MVPQGGVPFTAKWQMKKVCEGEEGVSVSWGPNKGEEGMQERCPKERMAVQR